MPLNKPLFVFVIKYIIYLSLIIYMYIFIPYKKKQMYYHRSNKKKKKRKTETKYNTYILSIKKKNKCLFIKKKEKIIE